MTLPADPYETILRERLQLVETIKVNTRRLSARLLGVLIKTFLPPALMFACCAALLTFVHALVLARWPDSFLATTLYIAGLLLTIFLMWRVWRWSEARFGGAGLVRRLGSVTLTVFAVEKAVDAAGQQPSPQDADRIIALAERAWDVYTEAMQTYGLQVE